MLESEAREKWCDRSIVAVAVSGVAFNRIVTPNGNVGVPLGTQCIASKCMRWIPCKVWSNDTSSALLNEPLGDCTLVSDGYCSYNAE